MLLNTDEIQMPMLFTGMLRGKLHTQAPLAWTVHRWLSKQLQSALKQTQLAQGHAELQGHATALQARSGLLVMPQVTDVKVLHIHPCVQAVDR